MTDLTYDTIVESMTCNGVMSEFYTVSLGMDLGGMDGTADGVINTVVREMMDAAGPQIVANP